MPQRPPPGPGLLIEKSRNLVVRDNHLFGFPQGVVVRETTDSRVESNVAHAPIAPPDAPARAAPAKEVAAEPSTQLPQSPLAAAKEMLGDALVKWTLGIAGSLLVAWLTHVAGWT